VQFAVEQATKVQRGSRDTSTLSVIWALDGDWWSTPRPGRFTPGKETPHPLYRWLRGLPTGIRPHDRPARSDYAIPAPFYALYRTSNKCLVKSDFELLSYYISGVIMICCAHYFGHYLDKGNCKQTRVKYGETSCARMPFW